MILHSLTLKNFKGLLAGVGLAEVTIDFDKLPNGLIAVVGSNGMGKTTLLDNFHPFRLMPYKLRKAAGWSPAAFSYYDECVGEAKKELIFSVGDVRYKSVLLIDADRRKQEATLYHLGDEAMYGGAARSGLHWIPLNDGKVKTYDESVEKVCGSPSLFFTSVFRAQGARNLSDYTRGDIMSVVAELLNIDHIKEQGEKARKVAAALNLQVDTLQRDRSALAGDDLPALRDELSRVVAEADTSSSHIAAYRHDLTTIEANRRELEIASAAEASTRQRIADKQILLQRLRAELAAGHLLGQRDSLVADLATVTNSRSPLLLRHSADIDRLTTKCAETKKILEREPAIRSAVTDLPLRQAALDESRVAVQAVRDRYASVREQAAVLSSLPGEIANHERQLASLQLRTSALAGLDCNGGGSGWINESCPLLRDAVAAQSEIAPTQAAIAGCKDRLSAKVGLDEKLAALKASGEKLAAEVATGEGGVRETQALANLLPQLEGAIVQCSGLEDEIVRLRSDHAVALADIDGRMADLRSRIEQVNADIDTFRGAKAQEVAAAEEEIRRLSASVGDGLASELSGLDQKAAEVRSVIERAEAGLRLKQEESGRLRARIESAEAAAAKVEEIDGKVAALNEEIANWNLLVKACGNDGVVALEIDDAGPSIAAICNDLLRTCYGPRFSIRLETQSMKVDGGAKEDFDITVFDSETGEQKSITSMSGGQCTWIEDALTRSICLYNIDRSSRVFGTLYSDEKDGALDPAKKVEFMAVKRQSMEVGSHTRELFITQAADLVDMADGVIRLLPGEVRVS
jgi:exonuclease SbcC